VVIFHIPSRPLDEVRQLNGKYLMRVNESILPMTPEQLKRIFNNQRQTALSPVYKILFAILVVAFVAALWLALTRKTHGTTDDATGIVQHPAQPPEVLKQPVEQPTIKSPEVATKRPTAKLQPTIIQTQAPYGNLAARCEELGNSIISTVEWRLKSRPDPATKRLEYNDWYRLNDGMFFHGPYYRDIAKIHKELSDLHIDDPRLDELIERHETYFASRQQNVQLAIDHPAMFHLSIEEIREVGERFKRLATQIPR